MRKQDNIISVPGNKANKMSYGSRDQLALRKHMMNYYY